MTEPHSPASLWDKNWETYRAEHKLENTSEIITCLSALNLNSQTRILEVGAGTGGDSATLSRFGAQVVCLDFSAQAVQLVAENARALQAPLLPVRGDAWTLPFRDDSFDVIFHQGFLEHFREPMALVEEQVRVLKPGGYLLVDVPQRYTLYALKKFYRVHTGRWFAGWERSFSIFELRRIAEKFNLAVAGEYGRGYSPHILHHLRYMQGLWSHKMLGGPRLRQINDTCWGWIEQTTLAKLYLNNIGALYQKNDTA
jgi:SAM-dependent methyltransferase